MHVCICIYTVTSTKVLRGNNVLMAVVPSVYQNARHTVWSCEYGTAVLRIWYQRNDGWLYRFQIWTCVRGLTFIVSISFRCCSHCCLISSLIVLFNPCIFMFLCNNKTLSVIKQRLSQKAIISGVTSFSVVVICYFLLTKYFYCLNLVAIFPHSQHMKKMSLCEHILL
jgi:hypothetical protein